MMVRSILALALLCSACTVEVSDTEPLPFGSRPFPIEAATFSPDIDNPWWPMRPGTRWVYREIDEEGTVVEVVVIVTTATETLANGVTARIVRDTVTEDGSIVEDTFDWYAQDAEGSIWYLGEDTAEFEDGAMTTRAGSWEAGVDGALPGIIMLADPLPGTSYRQEYYAGEAEDNGEVLSTRERVQIPLGTYEPAVLTKDTSTLEPDVVEYKFYARGVGPVLTLDISGGAGREELISMSEDLAAAEAAAVTPLGRPYAATGPGR